MFSGGDGAFLYEVSSDLDETPNAFGAAVEGGADVNGDGIPDFVVGAKEREAL